MKALSIRQPWASLIIAGVKPVENRTWKTNFRGRLLIHAAKAWDHDGKQFIMDQRECFERDYAKIIARAEQLRGGIIGSVNMTDCVEMHESKWFFGPYGFVFEDPINLDFEPYRGQLGFFDVQHYTHVPINLTPNKGERHGMLMHHIN